MRLLLDSQAIFLWFSGHGLPGPARRAVLDERNHVAISAASVWELGIKRAKGKLPVTEDQLRELVSGAFRLVAITPEHALAAASLPPLHRDPFDRMLVAQALAEDMAIVGGDPVFARYGVQVLWD